MTVNFSEVSEAPLEWGTQELGVSRDTFLKEQEQLQSLGFMRSPADNNLKETDHEIRIIYPNQRIKDSKYRSGRDQTMPHWKVALDDEVDLQFSRAKLCLDDSNYAKWRKDWESLRAKTRKKISKHATQDW